MFAKYLDNIYSRYDVLCFKVFNSYMYYIFTGVVSKVTALFLGVVSQIPGVLSAQFLGVGS